MNSDPHPLLLGLIILVIILSIIGLIMLGNIDKKLKTIPRYAGAGRSRPSIKLYSADWCPACKMFASKWAELEQDTDLQRDFDFQKVDVTDSKVAQSVLENTKIKGGGKILGWPTVTFCNGNGEEEIISGNFASVPEWKSKLGNFASKNY